jgi:diguanylate cyclase (GGDEF)-like protein
MKINIADTGAINKSLQRKKGGDTEAQEINLGRLLEEILSRANELVPSESGSILLDDPVIKAEGGEGKLCFLACFGEGSKSLAGTCLADHIGIVGETYRSGRPQLSKDVQKDDKFYAKIDKETKFVSHSIIAIPIDIGDSTIGVIELINRKDKTSYDQRDLALLKIFAGYTSTLIQNALDARRFEDMSKRDNLTGLYNDRYFYEMLTRGVKKGLEKNNDIALIFFDLDRFKEINDTYGHLAGSQVLVEVARLLEDVFSGIPATLARYGGDEYVILLPGMNPEEAGEYAEHFRKCVAENIFLSKPVKGAKEPLNIGGIITCSIGLASLLLNVEKTADLSAMEGRLLKAADKAMYRAKEEGKNRVVVSREIIGAEN